MSHFETNPFIGGTPEIAKPATRKQPNVTGSTRARPPSRSRSAVPLTRSIAPAARNKALL